MFENQNLSLFFKTLGLLLISKACSYMSAGTRVVPATIRKNGRDILLAGIGGIRACGRARGSIPLGLASASSHSALVSLGLYTVNTPSLMS